MRARLDVGEARVAARPAWPVVHAHLQRVGEGPAARVRQVLGRQRDDRLQVADDAAVVGTDVARRAVVRPRAPGRVWQRVAPVAVLDEVRPAGRVQQRRPEVEIVLLAATIELDRVEAELKSG